MRAISWQLRVRCKMMEPRCAGFVAGTRHANDAAERSRSLTIPAMGKFQQSPLRFDAPPAWADAGARITDTLAAARARLMEYHFGRDELSHRFRHESHTHQAWPRTLSMGRIGLFLVSAF